MDQFPPSYETALRQLQQELGQRLQEQQELSERIRWLQTTIAGFQGVSGQITNSDAVKAALGYDPAAGITSAIKNLLAFNPMRRFSASEIQQELTQYGVDFSRYKNALAVICSVLDRLERAQLVGAEVVRGRNLYEWAGGQPPQGGF